MGTERRCPAYAAGDCRRSLGLYSGRKWDCPGFANFPDVKLPLVRVKKCSCRRVSNFRSCRRAAVAGIV